MDEQPEPRLRIALIVGTLERGGAEGQVCRLAQELQGAGHEVRVFAQTAGGPLENTLRSSGVPYSVYEYRGWVRTPGNKIRRAIASIRPLLVLWRDLRRWRPDVCQAYLYQAYLWNMIGARFAGVPVRIAYRRSLAYDSARQWTARAVQWLSKRCTTIVVANSTAVAESVRVVEHLPASSVEVIRNGVDLAPEPADVTHQPPVGLMISNLIPYKGHDVVIDALLRIDNPPRIELIGEGVERNRIEDRIRSDGLAEVVEVRGAVDGAAKAWAKVQFGVLASDQEGLPNAVLEAMAHGVPVVSTAVGGVTELIEHDVSGVLVPPRDPDAMAQAIERVAGDPLLRQRMGEQARARAATFSWDACRDAHLDLYRRLGAGARGRAHRRRVPAMSAETSGP